MVSSESTAFTCSILNGSNCWVNTTLSGLPGSIFCSVVMSISCSLELMFHILSSWFGLGSELLGVSVVSGVPVEEGG